MAVYTKLTIDEITEITEKFSLGNLEQFTGIKEGIENTNYLIRTTKEKYILTIFEKRVKDIDIPFFVDVMNYLNKQEFFCPKPIKDIKGNYINKIYEKKYIIVSFLDGKAKIKPNEKDCFTIGVTLANMHNKTKKFKGIRCNSMSIDGWKYLFKKCSASISKYKMKQLDSLLLSDVENSLKFCNQNWPKNLPKGFIHGDVFPDNIFFKNNEICGIIDFYFSCTDFLVYEIAIALNAWCFDNDQYFNIQKAKSLLKGYNDKKIISKDEINSLSILSQGAALRFLLTRLYDWFNTPQDAVLNKKNPMEYLNKLRFFRDNNFTDQLFESN